MTHDVDMWEENQSRISTFLDFTANTYLVCEGKYAGHRTILAGGAGHGEFLTEFQGIWEGKVCFRYSAK